MADFLLPGTRMSPSESRVRRSVPTSVLLALCLAGPAIAQVATAPGEERPRVESVRFTGVESLEEAELRAAVATRETRCRAGFFLRPLCWITDWSAVIQHEFLDRAELPLDELRLEVHYFRRGYRQTLVTSELEPEGRGVAVVFHIVEGPPTVVEVLDVEQTEEVLRGRQIRRAQLPQEGEPLDLYRLEAALLELQERLGEQGFLDGEVQDDVEVDPASNVARVSVLIAPGMRSTVGELDIQGNERVADRVIVDAVGLEPEGVLRTRDLVGAQRSLYEANLFHEARVVLPPQPDSAKIVEVTVREAPPRSIRAGGGFNTMEFFQLEGRWTHYYWLGGGRRMDVQGAVGNLFARELRGQGIFRDVVPAGLTPEEAAPFLRPTWRAGVEFRQPSFLSAANRVGLGLFAHRRSVPGIVVDQGSGASLSFTRQLDLRTPLSVEYRLETTRVDAGDIYFCANYGICEPLSVEALRGRHRLSPLGLAFYRDEADDPLAPRTGYRLRFEVEHASAFTYSDYRYNRVAAEATGYLPLDIHRTRILAGRVRSGRVWPLEGTGEALGIETEGLALLHPRRRFFAGGSRSVRGFGENQLGPRVLTVAPRLLEEEAGCTPAEIAAGDCDPAGVPVDAFAPRPLGGTNVVEASVEYRFPFLGPFHWAVFLDGAVVGGQIGDLFLGGVAGLTPGFGVRWATGVAPIRIDIGFRPRLVEELQVLTEVVDAEGVRRLVLLDQPRIYDPVGDATGLWGAFVSRLRLHVSIGEAW